MTGNELAALITLILSMLPLTSLALLVYYIITKNDRPFLKFYGFLFGVRMDDEKK